MKRDWDASRATHADRLEGAQLARIREVSASAPLPVDRLTPDAPDGHYCLDALCESSVLVFRGVLPSTREDVEVLDAFMSDDARVPRTPNPFNSKTFLLRKQATFGARYAFARQANAYVPGPPSDWPRAVQDALTFARDVATVKGIAPAYYGGVHVNLYPSGAAGVQPHTDDEPHLLLGWPIVSCTLLAGERRARPFAIYLPSAQKGRAPLKVAEILLQHGDVVVMQGRMQQAFLHGVAPTHKAAFRQARRINLTVRAFDPNLQTDST